MRTPLYRWITKWSCLAVVAAACSAPLTSQAFSSYKTAFNSRYTTAGTKLDSCLLCHDSSPAGMSFNPYGDAVLGGLNGGLSIANTLASIEGVDSDGDGYLNLAEIQARSLPGSSADIPVVTAPIAGVAPTALPFGNVRTGTRATLTVTVTNSGTGALSVTNLALTGSADFGLTNAPALPLSIAARASAKITVSYAPGGTGADNGSLSIRNNDSAHSPLVVALTGTGVAPALTVTPVSLAFGNLKQGQTTNLSVTLGNNGGANCIISNLVKSGSTDFSFGPDAPVPPFVITPASTVVVPLVYTPTDVGADNGSIQVTSDDLSNPSVGVALSGTGDPIPTVANLTVNPTALDFGAVRVGQTLSLNVTVGNTGSTGCTVTAIGVTGSNFTKGAGAPSVPFNVGAGSSVTVPVVYAPSAAGNGIGTLTVSSTDPNHPTLNVSLGGIGIVPEIGLTPSAADFGIVTLGGSVTRSVTINNLGGAPLTVTSLVLTASAEFDYAAAGPFPPFVVAAGKSTNVTVKYTPANVGADAGTLAVGSDDPASPQVTATLGGSGREPVPEPQVTITPVSLAFGDVLTGQTKTLKVIVSNSGGAAANIGAPSLTGSADFSMKAAAFVLAAGATQDVSVVYTPGTPGADSGILAITSDDPDNARVSVMLSGNGIQSALSVSPTSVAFGSVVTNGTVVRVVTLANTGSAPAQVSALNLTGADFTLGAAAPALPFTVAVGATVDVPLSYRPATVGASSGSLVVVSTDPAHPTLSVNLSGTGILGANAVDMDISDFQATEKVQIGQAAKGVSTRVDFKLKLVSRSKVNVQRTATVTGVQNGIEVYSVSQVASIKGSKNGKEGSTELKLAAYVPTAEGTIQWTASVEDEDPDADVATRTTVVTLPPPVVLDLDIDSFQVPGALEVGKGKVEFKLKILSRSNAEGQRTLTVSGVRNGLEVYRFTQLVTVKKGKTDFKQPSPYVPTAAGTIQWTATVLDDDADVDVVVRTTVVTARPSQDDDEEDDGDEDDI